MQHEKEETADKILRSNEQHTKNTKTLTEKNKMLRKM